MKVVIIVQGRTTSSRVPAKALLPITGYPSAVLACLRASNMGRPTILATSDDPSDDVLAEEAIKRGVPTSRGPLHDVLARYFLAVDSLPDDCIVVRLTADNVVPDGMFVDELVEAFVSLGAEYLGMDPLLSRMPYGLGGEAFSVAALRKAHASAVSAGDREHVGPWMKRNCRTAYFTPRLNGNENFSHLRCTLDDEQDYLRVLRLFEGITNPLQIGWLALARKLAALSGEPAFCVPCRIVSGTIRSELTLGTAQLGMDYGAVNDSGMPSRRDGVAIVRQAVAHGVKALDTARAYGDAEAVLGEALTGGWRSRVSVVTKLDLSGLAADANESDVRGRIDESIDSSCRALRCAKLDTLLLHHWDHDRWQGAAWRHLLELREEGKIAVLGASVYEPFHALEALQDSAIEHLQIPMNVLDWRWKAAGVDRAIAARPGVVVDARSAFLQGILVYPTSRWPSVGDFDREDCGRRLRLLARKFGRNGLADLCLAYVRSLPWVSSVVVGCETMNQLDENLTLFLRSKLSSQQCAELEDTMPKVPENFLNPAKWNMAESRTAAYAS